MIQDPAQTVMTAAGARPDLARASLLPSWELKPWVYEGHPGPSSKCNPGQITGWIFNGVKISFMM